MVNKYELALIFKDGENSSAEGLNSVKELLKNSNIKITNEDIWGSRELAYPINKEKRGYYVILNLEGDSLAVKKIERDLRLNNTLLRFLTIKKVSRGKKQ